MHTVHSVLTFNALDAYIMCIMCLDGKRLKANKLCKVHKIAIKIITNRR